MDLVIEAWREHLAPFLAPLWDSATFWRTSVLLLLTVLAVAVMFRRWLADRVLGPGTREHDVAIFTAGNQLVDEPFLDDLLNRDLYNRHCQLDDIRRVPRFVGYLRRRENQYLDRSLRRVAAGLAQRLELVDGFVRKHFFTVRHDVGRLRLYPDDLIPKAAYDKAAAELHGLIGPAWKAFIKYRAQVQRRLRV